MIRLCCVSSADQCGWWVRESSGWRAESGGGGGGGGEARLSGLLADVLAGSTRRAPLRRALLLNLLHYARKLLALPLPGANTTSEAASPGTSDLAHSVSIFKHFFFLSV